MASISMQISAIVLLGSCFSIFEAKDSEICSHGVCVANSLKELEQVDVFDQAKELSLIQLTSMEKRAQDTEAAVGEQVSATWLDAAYKRKGESSDPAPAPAPETKDTSDSKVSSTTKKADPFSEGVEGCCDGKRDEDNGMLWRDNVTDFDACKATCRSFKDCGSIEYGWKDMPKWCAIWSTSQKCQKMDKDCKESVPGNGKGVKNYKFSAPLPTAKELAKTKWNVVGDGCCAGLRDATNGKLYADKEDDLDACKSRCLSFDKCGIVEYGWEKGDPKWCYIWDDSQKCEKLDSDCKGSVLGSGEGAKAHKYLKA